MNSLDGRIKANAAIVATGSGGEVSVYVTDPAHVILDVNGYFVPAGTPGALAFYALDPCRVIDTRITGGIVPAGGTRRISGVDSRFQRFVTRPSASGVWPNAKAAALRTLGSGSAASTASCGNAVATIIDRLDEMSDTRSESEWPSLMTTQVPVSAQDGFASAGPSNG